MTTKALDLVTIMHALSALEHEFLGKDRVWRTKSVPQAVIFAWYKQHKHELQKLTRIVSKASTDWQVLNKFLTDHRFDEMFNGPLDGIGAVSIIDMLVNWLVKASIVQIAGQNGQTYKGFEILGGGADVYHADGYQEPLVRVLTKTGDVVWLMTADEPKSGLELIEMAFGIVQAKLHPHENYEGARIPNIDFDVKPDIEFLCGANTYDANGGWWYISQAFQQFKLRMNKEGARVKVATGLAMRKAVSFDPVPYIFNKPFVGFFIQDGSSLPIGIFYADYDSWKDSGSLEDM